MSRSFSSRLMNEANERVGITLNLIAKGYVTCSSLLHRFIYLLMENFSLIHPSVKTISTYFLWNLSASNLDAILFSLLCFYWQFPSTLLHPLLSPRSTSHMLSSHTFYSLAPSQSYNDAIKQGDVTIVLLLSLVLSKNQRISLVVFYDTICKYT